MKILLLGKNGQLGWELQHSLTSLGEVTALDRYGSKGLTGDLTQLEGLRSTLKELKPDILVNAAAYTNVDKAENERELANLINFEAPKVMAEEMQKLGGWLVHFSTDYVFDGSGSTFWQENDVTAPLNQYGLSKLAGERAVTASGCHYLIFRTSWVYGIYGNNFVKSILKLAGERESLNIVNDQIGAPCHAELLAEKTVQTIPIASQNSRLSGIYHLTPTGQTSWYDYARFIIEHAKKLGHQLKIKSIKPISTMEYPTPAKRPLNSRLCTKKLCQNFHIELPSWQEGVMDFLQNMTLHEESYDPT